MSIVFYDHLLEFEKFESEIRKFFELEEERQELWNLVDEIVHQRVIISLLDRLSFELHQEFLEKVYNDPSDEGIFWYLGENLGYDPQDIIKAELVRIEDELSELLAEA